MNVIYEFGAVCLGAVGITASWRRPRATANVSRFFPVVVITVSSTINEGVLQPASDVMISGVDDLLSLRSAIDSALGKVEGKS